MTVSRKYGKDTAFGAWSRSNELLDSRYGTTVSDLDYVRDQTVAYRNYKKNKLMLIEVKTFGATPSYSQSQIYDYLDRGCQNNEGWNGMHYLIFERTCPRDGQIWLDNKIISERDLVEFLRFEKPDSWYQSYRRDNWPDHITFAQRGKTNWSKFGCAR